MVAHDQLLRACSTFAEVELPVTIRVTRDDAAASAWKGRVRVVTTAGRADAGRRRALEFTRIPIPGPRLNVPTAGARPQRHGTGWRGGKHVGSCAAGVIAVVTVWLATWRCAPRPVTPGSHRTSGTAKSLSGHGMAGAGCGKASRKVGLVSSTGSRSTPGPPGGRRRLLTCRRLTAELAAPRRGLIPCRHHAAEVPTTPFGVPDRSGAEGGGHRDNAGPDPARPTLRLLGGFPAAGGVPVPPQSRRRSCRRRGASVIARHRFHQRASEASRSECFHPGDRRRTRRPAGRRKSSRRC